MCVCARLILRIQSFCNVIERMFNGEERFLSSRRRRTAYLSKQQLLKSLVYSGAQPQGVNTNASKFSKKSKKKSYSGYCIDDTLFQHFFFNPIRAKSHFNGFRNDAMLLDRFNSFS